MLSTCETNLRALEKRNGVDNSESGEAGAESISNSLFNELCIFFALDLSF